MKNNLPTEVLLSDMADFQMSDTLAELLNEEITDFLSEKYGFCIEAYGWELKATGIQWDTDSYLEIRENSDHEYEIYDADGDLVKTFESKCAAEKYCEDYSGCNWGWA